MTALTDWTGQGDPCPVCGAPDPDHWWDVHGQPATTRSAAALRTAGGILARSSTRGDHTVRVLALHTTEGTSYTAAQLRDATWWEGSSHAIADGRTLLTPDDGCVPYGRASWTLRSGNPWSENLELCALARWTRAEWLQQEQLLEHAARWLAARSRARRIPLVKLTPAQYRAGGAGVIGHVDHTKGYGDGTHWDPGPGFPWDVVIGRAQRIAARGDALMALDHDEAQELLETVRQLHTQLYAGPHGKGWPSFRYDEGARTSMTPVDYVRGLDRELCTRYPRRATPTVNPDTPVGHILNLDARVTALDGKLQQVLDLLRQPRA